MTTRIVVSEDRCIGAGQCVLVDPEAFDQDDTSGMVVVLRPDPLTDSQLALAREAINVCPGRTLSLEEVE